MAEEMELYLELNLEPRIWIEAQPDLAFALAQRTKEPDDVVMQGAAWEERGVMFNFNVANNSQASSVLEFGTLNSHYPDITNIETVEVNSLILEDVLVSFDSVTLLNLDIQGAELYALRGAGSELKKVKAIYTEVNFEEI
jgi:FkbM family methyltransferase